MIVGSLDEIGVAAYREYQRWITERRRGGQPIPASDLIDADAAIARHALPRFDA